MKILGISGKKQAGKNTMFNLILGVEMLNLALVRNTVKITDQGKLEISDLFGDNEYQGIFDVTRNTTEMHKFLNEYIYPYIKNYSYADILKKEVCIKILGLTYDQCYGTDEQKNTLTNLRWENMPGNVEIDQRETESLGNTYYVLTPKSRGLMTAREVMQYVGTNIFRQMNNTVWADACIRQILQEESEFAIVTDVRFPDEVMAIKNAGGKVIRLTRDIFKGEDTHKSEKALDPNFFCWDNFDAVIDNDKLTIGEQNEQMLNILKDWSWIKIESK